MTAAPAPPRCSSWAASCAAAPPFTIELLFFDGEEAINWDWKGYDNTYGSRHHVEQAQSSGTLAGLRALMLLDLIGYRHLDIRRESTSTEWLTDLVWNSARDIGHGAHSSPKRSPSTTTTPPSCAPASPRSTSSIPDYRAWHTPSATTCPP